MQTLSFLLCRCLPCCQMYVDRKSLCLLAETEPVSFKCLVDEAKRHLQDARIRRPLAECCRMVRPQSMEWVATSHLPQKLASMFDRASPGPKPLQVLNGC